MNLAFTKHIINALIGVREERLKCEFSIPRKLEDAWEPTIKMKVNDFECSAFVILVLVSPLCQKSYMMPLILDH